MRDDLDAQTQLNTQLLGGQSRLARGVCQSIDWVKGLATVNVAGATIALQMVGVPPLIGDPCVVGYFGSQPVVLGPVPRSPFATTTSAISGGLVAVTGDDNIADRVSSDGFTLPTGTRVLVDWSGGGCVTAVLTADPNTGRPVNTGGTVPTPSRRTVTFSPVASGTQTGGAGSFWTNQVWCGDSTVGAYVYGPQVADTIPDGATIISGFIHLVVDGSDYGDAPTIGTCPQGSLSGVISASNVQGISAGSGDKGLSGTILNALKVGTARGLATAHGGYHVYAASPGSGALTITWQS